MTDLPPFSGDDPTCPKCGNVGARTEYTNPRSHGGIGWHHYEYPTGPRVEVEHLRRECERCGYGWPEATVEAKEAGDCRCESIPDFPCPAKAKHPDGLCEECHQNDVACMKCITVEIVGGPVSGNFHTTHHLISTKEVR